MSHEPNTELYERASEMITYFEGKLPAQIIERDLGANDLDALYRHVCSAESIAAQQEMAGIDI